MHSENQDDLSRIAAQPWPRGHRRQFLQRAAAGVVCASAVGSTARAQPPRAKPSVFRAVEINHLALDTSDRMRAIAFYESTFGMTNISHGRIVRDTFLHFEKGFINMGDASAAGLNHLCLGIEDFSPDVVFRRLDALGLAPFRMGGGNLLHVIGPDDINVQIQEIAHGYGRTPAAQLTSAKKGLFETAAIHHIALNVTDLARAREFFADLFSLPITEGANDMRCVLGVGTGFLELLKADKAGMHHHCYAVKAFDAKAAAEKLKRAGVELVEIDEPNVVSFRDTEGLLVQATKA